MNQIARLYVGTYSRPLIFGTGEVFEGKGKGIHAYLFDISINQSTEKGYDAKFKIDAPNGVKKSSSTRAIRPILAF